MPGRFLHSGNVRERMVDASVLLLILTLSALPYIRHLGFYSDDWDLLAQFERAARSGHSVIGTTLPNYGVRPVQGIYLGLLYDAFGLEPLGYHIVNTAVIAIAVVLLYLLLLRFRFARAEAFAAALIFALMPQLSTVRVWFASFQIPLSMAFALLAMHAQLSFGERRRGWWIALAIAATCLSIGAYEIFAPLIAGFALWLLLDARRSHLGRSACAAPILVLAAVAICTALKFFTNRSGDLINPGDYVQMARVFLTPWYDWRVGYGLNVFAALQVHFWLPLCEWSLAFAHLFTGRAGGAVSAISVTAGALGWWRTGRASNEHGSLRPGRVLLVGIVAFLLGHATFLISAAIMFADVGIGNRALVAGAMGAAIVLVGLAGLLASAVAARWRHALFASLITIATMGALVRIELVERYWAEAPVLERQVLDAARADLARLPPGSTVILDGVCPYQGPAIVFENDWDTAGALSLALGRDIAANVVSPRMTLTPTGLATSIYDFRSFYPYATTLFIYDPRVHRLVQLADARAARRYFSSSHRRRLSCPAGFVGIGVPV